MNIELLQKVRDYMASLPSEKIEMEYYVLGAETTDELDECGTAGCIAGYTCFVGERSVRWEQAHVAAACLLDIPLTVANVLFALYTHTCTPSRAIARLDYLITHPEATSEQLTAFIVEHERQTT